MTEQPNNPSTFPKHLRYWHIAIAVSVVLLAFALRTATVLQRIQHDPTAIPVAGVDHYTYLMNGQGILNGTFPREPFYFHPAPSYFYALLYATVADSWLHIAFIMAMLDALVCGWLIGAGWLITRKLSGGVLVGGMYALYPVAIFYASSFLIAPLATHLLALFIFLTLWQREKLSEWRTILLGVIAGAIAISRLNMIPIVGLYLLWLMVITPTWRTRILHSLVFIGVMLAVISPFTWHNYQSSGGKFIPVATTGSRELYMANNRDARGRYGFSVAYDALETNYRDGLIRDVQLAPMRFAQLLGYKFSLFWSVGEAGNNLSYAVTRDAVPLLRLLPLNFLWLSLPMWFGAAFLWRHDRKTTLFLFAIVAWMAFSFTLVFAFSRLRFPVVIPMILLMSGLVLIPDQRRMQYLVQRVLIFGAIGVLLVVLGMWQPKPSERIYRQLPDDVRVLNAPFGEITLLGWRPVDGWVTAENSWGTVDDAYTVELFWQVAQPTDIDYQFYLGYIVDGQRVFGVDRPLGGVSFPTRTTDTWDRRIYSEIIGLSLNPETLSVREFITGHMVVGVYYRDDSGQIQNQLVNNAPFAILQPFTIYPERATETQLFDNSIIFGDQIVLVENTIITDDDSTISLIWQAIRNIDQDYIVFVHVEDETGEVVHFGDTPLMPPSQTWQPYRQFEMQIPLPPMTTDETYAVYMGLYHPETGRLTTDTPDNRIFIGAISRDE